MSIELSFDVGIVLLLAMVLVELRVQHRRDRDAERVEQARRQVEIYQRLELASNDLHRFEADHVDLIRPLYTGVGVPTEVGERHVYVGYVCQLLNLFELQVELFCSGLVDEEELGTWVPWFNEVGRAKGFREVWEEDLRAQYSARLVRVLDRVMEGDGPATRATVLAALER